MKQTNILLTSFLLLTLAGGVSNAQGVSKWKYVPQAFKKTKIPGVLNPKLPLQTQVKWGTLNPVLDKTVVRAAANAQTSALPVSPVTTAAPIPASCPERFVNFVHWLDELIPNHLAVKNDNTQQALSAIRHAIIHYNVLPREERPFLNGLVITLSKMQPHLKFLPDGSLQRLIYVAQTPNGKLPQAHHFQLQVKQNGLTDPLYNPYEKKKNLWNQSFRLTRYKDNPQRIRAIVFFQGYMPQTAREELIKVLEKITPQGYRIRMGAQELGLDKEDLSKFREGKLHLHIETEQPITEGPFPTQKSIEIMISPKPYAGIIDVHTRQILIPNNDQTIARNYLTLFEPFLNEEGKTALQEIINGH